MYQCETQYHRQIACCSPRNPYPCETKYRKINARGWCCSPRNLHQCETNPKAAPKIISVAVLEIFTSAKQIHRTPRPIVCVAVLEIFTSAKLNLITINVFIECCSPRNLHQCETGLVWTLPLKKCCSPRNLHQCETHIRSSVYAISVAVLEIFTSAKLQHQLRRIPSVLQSSKSSPVRNRTPVKCQ